MIITNCPFYRFIEVDIFADIYRMICFPIRFRARRRRWEAVAAILVVGIKIECDLRVCFIICVWYNLYCIIIYILMLKEPLTLINIILFIHSGMFFLSSSSFVSFWIIRTLVAITQMISGHFQEHCLLSLWSFRMWIFFKAIKMPKNHTKKDNKFDKGHCKQSILFLYSWTQVGHTRTCICLF